MPISRDLAEAHVAKQSERMENLSRSAWPKYLFHFCHVTNAVRIVTSGAMRARAGCNDFHDIANQEALGAYLGSHDYARLYFRPKNGFHLRTEGIKCCDDPYRLASQASVPVMLLFDAVNVLTRPGVNFTRGNIQRACNIELDGDASFRELDFLAIYHDEPVSAEHMDYIHSCRMAEVMVPEELPLEGNLALIYFRTRYDEETFRWLLAQEGMTCTHKTAIENITGSVFMRWGMYINDVNYVDDTLTVELKLPNKYTSKDGCYRIKIEQTSQHGQLIFERRVKLSGNAVRVRKFIPAKDAVWRIEVEDVLAFHGQLAHQRSELFR